MFDIHVILQNSPDTLSRLTMLLGHQGVGLEGGGLKQTRFPLFVCNTLMKSVTFPQTLLRLTNRHKKTTPLYNLLNPKYFN